MVSQTCKLNLREESPRTNDDAGATCLCCGLEHPKSSTLHSFGTVQESTSCRRTRDSGRVLRRGSFHLLAAVVHWATDTSDPGTRRTLTRSEPLGAICMAREGTQWGV